MAPSPDDPRYFGYTTGQNTALTELWRLGQHMGEDLRHYPPPPNLEHPSDWTRDPEDVDWNDDAGRDWVNNNTVELIYSRVMSQNAEDVDRLGTQWYKLGLALGSLAYRILQTANGLRYGGDGSPDGTGWTGLGADAFLARGPGATIMSLDGWRDAAYINAEGSHILAGHIRDYQERMQTLYDTYKNAMVQAHNRWWDTYGPIDEPRTLATLNENSNSYLRDDYIDALREEELFYRNQAQGIQYEMAQQYWTDLRTVNGGRATVYEGPRDAVRENFDFVAKALAPTPPSISPPSVGTPPAVPPLTIAPVLPPPPVAPTPPGVPISTPNVPPAPSPTDLTAPTAPTAPGIAPIAPLAPAPPVAPALPTGAKAPTAPSMPGMPPGGRPPGAGGRSTVPGVLRNGLSGAPPDSVPPGTSRPPGAPGMPPGRSQQRPDGSPPGTQVVGPTPEAFGDSTGTTPPPPPVLRGPHTGGAPPGSPTRARPTSSGPGATGADAGGPPPSGVAPPVLNRPHPTRPERPVHQRPVRPAAGDFAPRTVAGGPVLGRTPPAVDGPSSGRPPSEGPGQGVVRAPRPAVDAGQLGARGDTAGPAAKSTVDEEYEKIRALFLDGESAFQVRTPGGAVVTTPPPQPVDVASEPKPHLRGGAA